MIELNEVAVSLQDHPLFHSLTLSFESGVSYLLKGENGAGKTILLKLLAGKTQPGKGSIHYDFIDDHLDWEQKFELRKKYIHFIPTHALHELVSAPDLFYQQRYYTIESSPIPTVRDYFGERMKNLSGLQLPESFQLTHLLDLELIRLSNGQVKKVIILKQLLDTIPRILLLDYPFEGLDVKSRSELSNFLDHLAEVHRIQLIIADNEHPHLPNAISKHVVIGDDSTAITDRVSTTSLLANHVESNPVKSSAESDPVVEMQSVKIQYGSKVILENLSWKIHRGERWALTGPNGSGKTTLFSLIYADHPMAYSEKIFLFGKRRGSGESIWDIKKRISYLGPEQLHFLDDATEQLTVRAFLEKERMTAHQLPHLITYFQMERLLARKLRQLSNGQLQLVLLISLFLSQKELLLLDEPFQFLDPVQKTRVNEYLHSHLDESTTLVLITHYEDDVAHWTHHRLIL